MPPSIINKIDSFFSSMGRAAEAAMTPGVTVLAEPAFARQRRSICNGCPNLKGSQCGICGCFVAAKTKLITEKCPAGKW